MTSLTIFDKPDKTIRMSHYGHSKGESWGSQAGLTPHPRQGHQKEAQGLIGEGGNMET